MRPVQPPGLLVRRAAPEAVLTVAHDIEPAALRAEAQVLLARGDLVGAVSAYVDALELDPRRREEARRLCMVLGEVGRHALARPLEQALERARQVDYQWRVLDLRRSRYLDFPRHVHLETMARCNAACDFCPSSVLKRSGARMSDDLIDKVLTDLEDMPRDLSFQVSPYKVNEPFLDVRIFDVLDDIARRLPQASIALTSNASALTDKKIARLAGRPTLGDLFISFNDHRPEVYQQVMQLPYARTLERLDALHAAVASGSLDLRVTISRVGDGSPVDDAFRIWVAGRWSAFKVLVMQRGSWIGQVDTPIGAVPDVGCQRWFELSITATGEVAHCCMDGQSAWPIGDVRTTHALEIYNEPGYRALRELAISRRGVQPCGTCTFY